MVKKKDEFEQKIAELTLDLQRTRADFENYRKRVESEKVAARQTGEASAILKLLPVIDNLERAISHLPDELKDNAWAAGVVGVAKKLDKMLAELKLERMVIIPGKTEFNHDLHQAIQFDEESTGDIEVIAAELQSGYLLDGVPIRHAMVKVARR